MVFVMKAKKSLGQHFLTSKPAVYSIVEAGNLSEDDFVLEIGPGKGFLTEELLKKSKVLAVEKDVEMIQILEEKFSKEIKEGKLKILNDDILNLDIEKIEKKYRLIANIPYYITGEILRKFLETENRPEIMVLLVQKEVAQRIASKNNKESILSLSVKFFGRPEIIKIVKAGSFNPKPKVDSAIIKITITEKRNKEETLEFFDIVKTGFSHKRKKLLGNLSSIYSKNQITLAFERLNIPENSRAEDLKLETWIKLVSILKPQL